MKLRKASGGLALWVVGSFLGNTVALAQSTEPPPATAAPLDPQPASAPEAAEPPAAPSAPTTTAPAQTPAPPPVAPAKNPPLVAAAQPSPLPAVNPTNVVVAATPPPAPVATVSDSADSAQAPQTPASDKDPWARPFFVKGELNSFSVRPMTRRNFIGVGAGLSAIPNDTETILNAFYFTVEPQLDIVNTKYNWRLGLGAPLQFELVNTRGAFEVCLNEGRQSRMSGGNQDAVAADTALCVADNKDRITENFGKLRKADWDEPSDFAKIIRYMVIGGQEQPFYLNLSRLYDQSLGHGTVIRDYNPNIDYNTARLGATLDFNRSAVGIQAMANDLVNPDVLGLMAFIRPLRPYSQNVLLRSLSFGFNFVHGVNQPRHLLYEAGLFTPSFDQPIPKVDSNLNLVGGHYQAVDIIGGDVEAKLIRTDTADMKLYIDYQKIKGHGGGTTLGSLWRFSFGQPANMATRSRVEINYFDPDYLPSYFDTYHDIFQYQYLPQTYGAANKLQYHPTKLQYLEASKGGRKRIGAYLELSHAFLNYFTVGAVARTWRPMGSPANAGFTGPTYPDYNQNCANKDGELTCPDSVLMPKEESFTSLRLYAELPLRRYLQTFVSYEVFSTTAEQGGLGLFKFNGDNEILFSGARIMLLPIFFIQAEARRYFFLQRVHNVNIEQLTLEQDQNYHANWTFAVNAFVGYEF